MPSVMQKIVSIPAPAASRIASGAPGRRDVDAARVGAGLADGLGDRVEDRHPAVEGLLAALVGGDPGDDPGPVLEHRPGVELALPAGDPLDDQAGLASDEDAHRPAAAGGGAVAAARAAATALAAASSRLAAVAKWLASRRVGRLRRVRADDPDDHRHVAGLHGTRLDQAPGDLVAARDPAEDVDQDRGDLGIGQDQAHRRRHLVGPRPAADVEEVGGLAAGPLDEVHRRHRQPGAVDHAADRAVELDEVDALLAGLPSTGSSSSRSRRASSAGCRKRAESSRVIFASRQANRSTGLPSAAVSRTMASGIDLDEIGVVGQHRGHQALRDLDEVAQVWPAEADGEGQLAGLPVEEAEVGMGLEPMDRSGIDLGDLLDLDAAFGRGHDDDPPADPVEDRPEVVLAGDVGGRPDEELANRDALDLEGQDRLRRRLGGVGVGGHLDPAGLAPATDQDLGLDHDQGGAGGERALGCGPGFGGGSDDLPGGHRQALLPGGGTWRRLPGSSRSQVSWDGRAVTFEAGKGMVPRRSPGRGTAGGRSRPAFGLEWPPEGLQPGRTRPSSRLF